MALMDQHTLCLPAGIFSCALLLEVTRLRIAWRDSMRRENILPLAGCSGSVGIQTLQVQVGAVRHLDHFSICEVSLCFCHHV